MIEILDPRSMSVYPATWSLGSGWHYPLDYTWAINQVGAFVLPGERILDVGSLYSGLGKYLKSIGYNVHTVDRDVSSKADTIGDFLELSIPTNLYNAITWISSIEHQDSLSDIERCYSRSMDLLRPGGVFIATVGICPDRSYYWEEIKGWVLSLRDSMRIFDSKVVKGRYKNIWPAYRDNVYKLRDSYVARFGAWDNYSPAYIAAGVVKVK